MQFYLTGGGDYEHFHRLEAEINRLLPPDSQALVIPYATDSDLYPDIRDHVADTFFAGQRQQVKIYQHPDKIPADDIAQCELIFIEGGNTFDLITTVRTNNIETGLKEHLNREDGIVYADSAGAILLGKSVATAFFGDDADEDSQRLQDYRGLNLLSSWSIHAHYTPEDDDAVMNLIYQEGAPVMALYEESGVFLAANGTGKVYGEAPLVIFNFTGKTELPVGTEFNLAEFY